MNGYDSIINELLLDIFDKILVTEEKALRKGSFSDLSVAEMHTLEGIGLYETRTMSETAANLGITTGTLTVAVDRLVRKGYVERQRDTSDRRVVRVRLTRKGKLAFRMHNKFHKLLVDRIVEPLDEPERQMLLRLLQQVSGFVGDQYQRYNLVSGGGKGHDSQPDGN